MLPYGFIERIEADASRSRESLTPPSLNPAYKIEINHDNDDDSGDLILKFEFRARQGISKERERNGKYIYQQEEIF